MFNFSAGFHSQGFMGSINLNVCYRDRYR